MFASCGWVGDKGKGEGTMSNHKHFCDWMRDVGYYHATIQCVDSSIDDLIFIVISKIGLCKNLTGIKGGQMDDVLKNLRQASKTIALMKKTLLDYECSALERHSQRQNAKEKDAD